MQLWKAPLKWLKEKFLNQDGQYFFDAFQRTEIGALIGLDLDLSSHVRVSLNAQMHVGYPLADYSEADSVRFRTVTVSVGYMF